VAGAADKHVSHAGFIGSSWSSLILFKGNQGIKMRIDTDTTMRDLSSLGEARHV